MLAVAIPIGLRAKKLRNTIALRGMIRGARGFHFAPASGP
jgi:hypothetical protein